MQAIEFLKPLLRRLTLALALLPAAWAPMLSHAADDFLEPEKAFAFAARALDERTVEVTYTIAPGYYLYREKFAFEAAPATLAAVQLPPGKVKFDETFQKNVETHRGVVRIAVPVAQANGPFRLTVTSQGCADQGLCYPPMQSVADVSLAGYGGDGTVRLAAAESGSSNLLATATQLTPSNPARASTASPGSVAPPTRGIDMNTASPTDSARIDAVLRDGRTWVVVAAFFAAGVLLSLTPCVLPMLPILSAIIVGQGKHVSRGRGLLLAGSYSLGMALVYTAFGIAAGLAGEGLAAALQSPWVLGSFALGLVALALSMFGVYELQLPQALTGPLAQASQGLRGGRMAGVFAMGGVSALIVSPCIAAPLAGALVYLSQTRDVWLGGSALFSLAAGMSVPLLLLGASAGTLLPRTGAWMDDVKRFFGLLLLGVALWTARTLFPSALVLAAWGTLSIAVASLLWSAAASRAGGSGSARLAQRTGGAVFAVLGLMQLVGAASGGSDPLQPLAHWSSRSGGLAAETLNFRRIRNVVELDEALRSANRPVMLDFSAEWCVSCKEMERYTFSDAGVRSQLSKALVLQADVTENNPQDRELLKRFGLFGPPGTIFFDEKGVEIKGVRVIGYQDASRFRKTLGAVGL